jgi:hypothetical protein
MWIWLVEVPGQNRRRVAGHWEYTSLWTGVTMLLFQAVREIGVRQSSNILFPLIKIYFETFKCLMFRRKDMKKFRTKI